MTWVRSALFNVAFYVWLTFMLIVMLGMLPLPYRVMLATVRVWARGVRVGLKVLVGLGFEVRGRENMPAGAAIYACKHQSLWETFVLCLLIPDAAFVMKKELFAIPLWGWFARKCRSIPVDRAGGAKALRRLLGAALEEIAAGRSIVIFPEGTRTAPGRRRPYQPGVAALYGRAGLPVVPVALNSGLFWGRRAFVKHPGVITVQFLPAIAPGLDRRAFMAALEAGIEAAADRLAAEARTRFFPAAGDGRARRGQACG